MMRPTAKDLAEAAGVSLATVDRVLNDRPNVSPKAAKAVNDAIARIGFIRNPAAVVLARNKNYRFRFVLPQKGDEYLNELLRQVSNARENNRAELTDISVEQIATDDPHRLSRYLAGLEKSETDGVAVMAPESPQVRDALGRAINRGIHVVQFLAGQEKLEAADFVGVDNFAAGATAAKLIGRFVGANPSKIMIVSESMSARDSLERRRGFDSIIIGQFPHLKTLPSLETYGDERRAGDVIKKLMAHNRDISAAYILSSESRVPVAALSECIDLNHLTLVAHERTPFNVRALDTGSIDAIIAQDPGHAVRSAIRILRARNDLREPVAAQEKIRIEVLLKENL